MDGLLIIDKPKGPTSHDVVARVRRALAERRVGHTGTLDPMASGVLPLVLGRATRLARFLTMADKSYEAVIRLGMDTDTYDAEGIPANTTHEGPMPSRDAIDEALGSFRGTFLQRPPRFSAKKIDGQRSYTVARAQRRNPPVRPVAPSPVSVTARTIDIVDIEGSLLTLRMDCSTGFYVRSLAHDLGERLGIGGHLVRLRRTRSGDATLADAVPLDLVEREPSRAMHAVVPIARMLPTLSCVVLTKDGVQRAGHGRDLGPAQFEARVESRDSFGEPASDPALIRLLDCDGQLVGLAAPDATSGLLHPCLILR
jgi:tRNA pseudouridine55 synthase